MKVVQFALESALFAINLPKAIGALTTLIETVESGDLKGEDKKKAVFEQFKALGYGITTWVTNLLIEIIVGIANAKLQKAITEPTNS